jgi:hypothetical protein
MNQVYVLKNSGIKAPKGSMRYASPRLYGL